jgi:MSHA pilin protein MshD
MPQLKLLRNRSRRALTLLEVVVATLVTGAMLVAALESVGAVFHTNRQNADRLRGMSLTHELMAEIMAMPYKDPTATTSLLGTESGESTASRATFDDVDDYNGLNIVGLRTKSGTVRPVFAGWRTQAQVEWIEVSTGLVWILGDTGLKRITVTVTSPTGDATQLVGYRFQEGVLEKSPAVDTSAVTWIGAELQLGPDSNPSRMGVNLLNHTPDAE